MRIPQLVSTFFLALVVAQATAACAWDEAANDRHRGTLGDDDDDDDDGTVDADGDGIPDALSGPEAAKICQKGQPHLGFAKMDFVADRVQAAVGMDRRRVKPFSALTTEFARALGTAPAALTSNAAAFGTVPPRWYVEPTANAVNLYTNYSVGFSGCYDKMTEATYAAAPTAQTAEAECSRMQKAYWLKTPTTEEIGACRDLAMTALASEANPRRRWAHLCASVLTSAGFTTY